jgi:uncharacterized CHY-type Zn-finger protein
MYLQIMHGHYKYGTEPKLTFNASNIICLIKYMQKKKLQHSTKCAYTNQDFHPKCNKQNQTYITLITD